MKRPREQGQYSSLSRTGNITEKRMYSNSHLSEEIHVVTRTKMPAKGVAVRSENSAGLVELANELRPSYLTLPGVCSEPDDMLSFLAKKASNLRVLESGYWAELVGFANKPQVGCYPLLICPKHRGSFAADILLSSSFSGSTGHIGWASGAICTPHCRCQATAGGKYYASKRVSPFGCIGVASGTRMFCAFAI